MSKEAPARSPAWKWYICGLLLLATTINYMDRQTLSSSAARIIKEFELSKEQYGELELAFGLAFAVGASLFGFIADRTNVRWLYPAILVLWSAMGFATGLVQTFFGLMVCRTLLGIFEAGHWPCALKTTQRLLPPKDRGMGNSLLQSGTSLGAIITPLLMNMLLTDEPGSWRVVFQGIGLFGTVWIVFWFLSIRSSDLAPLPPIAASGGTASTADSASFWQVVFSRRFFVLVTLVIGINMCWHVFRVWLPLFLQHGRGYSEKYALNFTSLYYLVTDAGCILAGMATLFFHRYGMAVHQARSLVFFFCSLLTAFSTLIIFLPAGWPLLGVLLTVGFGGLGLFPCYYSFSQELTVQHQGKVSGLLGSFAWVTSAVAHKFFGRYVDVTGSYDWGMAMAGWSPVLAFLVLWFLWDSHPREVRSVVASEIV